MPKGLTLFSGGLDSLLAAKILGRQNIIVEAICFKSNFFDCKKARIAAEKNGIKLHVQDISEEMIDLVKNPENGFGKNFNPCIDCHTLMIKRASKFAQENDFDFLATGEVLGQRPFSQNKKALNQIQKKAGVEVLRPLSAKLLEETSMEKQGLINREGLLDIHGRSREKQNNLIREFSVKEYESPGGGCLLTDPGFSQRLSKALQMVPNLGVEGIELLKKGRLYWFWLDKSPVLLVVGRDKEENEELKCLVERNDLLIYPQDLKGPVSLLKFFGEKVKPIGVKKEKVELQIPSKEAGLEIKEKLEKLEKLIQLAAKLTGWHTPSKRGKRECFVLRFF
ncbi:MAG: tRNA 4-thiouridine(8) synthase ThiI [Patescibacteria group bacterium]